MSHSYPLRFLFWITVLNFLDLAAKYLPVRKDRGQRQKVAFIRMDGIGDYVIWSGTFGAIREAFPSEKFETVLIGNKLWKDLADRDDDFETRIYIDPRRAIYHPIYRFNKMRRIRKLMTDVIVNPRTTREFILMDSVVRVSGATVRIGSLGIANRMNSLQKAISDRWYTVLVDGPKKGEHELEYYERFAKAYSDSVNVSVLPRTDPSKMEALDSFELSGKEFVLIFLGAQQPGRRWPPEKFAQAALHAKKTYGFEVVLCGGADERYLVDRFANSFDGDFRDLVGLLTVTELCDLIAAAQLVISNDTGAGHIAMFEATPSVILNPGNYVGRFFPYPERFGAKTEKQIALDKPMPCFGCDWDCVFTDLPPSDPKPCIADIRESDVFRAIDKLLRSVV